MFDSSFLSITLKPATNHGLNRTGWTPGAVSPLMSCDPGVSHIRCLWLVMVANKVVSVSTFVTRRDDGMTADEQFRVTKHTKASVEEHKRRSGTAGPSFAVHHLHAGRSWSLIKIVSSVIRRSGVRRGVDYDYQMCAHVLKERDETSMGSREHKEDGSLARVEDSFLVP
jgi:hypothetical protein